MKKNKNRNIYFSENISWALQKGSWILHFILTFIIYTIFEQLFNYNLSLQLTLISDNVLTFIFFHWIVGDPFDKNYREFTFWEQLSEQMEANSTLIFMSLYPIGLFMIVSRFVKWNLKLYFISLVTLILITVPKLSFMHMKRLFGVKRYD
ncbi:hypothetical protein EHP00_1808 [Ecytonucleospora hepatopenaei]|uniref:Uncharacterized protein n=1 Tax=Ecytonucleospora hepatopenaei TaxID=646526 RepID=A0A1W0E749_9MICR|nr:hypothetical protein EHP00_1808 [Ecytonucleospora hepatopenaei]